MHKVILALAAACLSSTLLAQSPPVSLKGHDPVAYFTDGRPVKGSAGINYDFDDIRYHFKTPKNRELFASNPDRYAPQFAGLCTAGLSMGMRVEADPNIWKVVDGKLYVFASIQGRERIEKDPSLLAKSHQNWKPGR